MPLWKLLRGVHSEGGKVYKKGDIIKSSADLGKKFNHPHAQKFEPVSEDSFKPSKGVPMNEVTMGITKEQEEESVVAVMEPEQEETDDNPSPYDQDELQAMKVKELETIAEEAGVDLEDISRSPAHRKKQLIAAILGK